MKFKSTIPAIILVLVLLVPAEAKRSHHRRAKTRTTTQKVAPRFDAAAMMKLQQRNDRTCDGDYDQRKMMRKQ